MRLARLSEFRSHFFTPASAPALKTLRARIDRGDLPGGRVDGGRYYVDLDEYNRVTRFRSTAERLRDEAAENPLLQGLV